MAKLRTLGMYGTPDGGGGLSPWGWGTHMGLASLSIRSSAASFVFSAASPGFLLSGGGSSASVSIS